MGCEWIPRDQARHVDLGAACRDAEAPFRVAHIPVRSRRRKGRVGYHAVKDWSALRRTFLRD
ncbi:hypothetical protein GCM10009691_41500 [Brevibacterium picturae]|uniref:Transposase n=1 Tax=Brevibacterium picturae TaxID=260553 RepID=A0ABP4NPZ4_9MICO